ncbi:hypothetical protein LU699_11190 [Luteimonas fraxinea]|uniref:Lipoprotein n=1 Tax=Luteimonas fraxinea TaxID=2901869 RepID=A0ABS8UG00_9GAMM|nr:hypothetical protein [Luteimonas fraxinea]MCD9098184.1 hypothetical protein [Luteimonas fraxinea]MCD9126910.1 hypothetical protein [Luteimonas fraxinea]UHH08874.1 hypothetical protein LU699_11190 [Luteimonas fraxinea]
MKILILPLMALGLTACSGHPGSGARGPAAPQPEVRSYGNDALASAEVKAYERAHARYKYRDSRIEWDSRNCAVYEGTASDGKRVQHALSDERNQPICAKP